MFVGALTSVNQLVNFSSCRDPNKDTDKAPLLQESVTPEIQVFIISLRNLTGYELSQLF